MCCNSIVSQINVAMCKKVSFQNYVSYDKKKSRKLHRSEYNSNSSASSKQNSSSTGSTKLCFQHREPYSSKHEKECKAKCDECGVIGHFKRCCKKLGNFPNNSNQQNTSSLFSGGMHIVESASRLTDTEFFNERRLPKQYNPQFQ